MVGKGSTVAAPARAAGVPPATPRVPVPLLSVDGLVTLGAACRAVLGPARPRGLAVVLLLVAVVRARLTPHMSGGVHLVDCRRGMSVDGFRPPAGAPCSRSCAAAQLALGLGLRELRRLAVSGGR